MDRLLSMRVFERVVDEGSFAGAARALAGEAVAPHAAARARLTLAGLATVNVAMAAIFGP